ncbi:putative transcription factor ssDNA-binding-TF family [Helianthus debilis subsp. tardiflorus]
MNNHTVFLMIKLFYITENFVCYTVCHTKVERRGVIMLTFRPAIGERKYDSEKKQLFALSVTEVGSFISLGPGDSCEFFHDPSIQSRDAGQVRKSLSVKAHMQMVISFI